MDQDRLTARLHSADFSCDHLQIHRVEGHEAISRMFAFVIDLICIEPGVLEPQAVAGAEATLVFEHGGAVVREVHGMVAEVVDMLDSEPEYRSYRLVLVPRAHRLTLVEMQEVFLDQSVPGIVAQKLENVGLGGDDVEMHLLGKYQPREFVVQYKETDLAFVSRLTEHLGMSFFFVHGSDRDTIVFTDHPDGFADLAGGGKVPFCARGEQRDVFALESTTRVYPGGYFEQDYNYRTPRLDLAARYEVPGGYAGGVLEYGAHFKTPEEGEAMARLRAEEREAASRFYRGESSVVAFAAGARFTLEGHPRLDDQALLLVEVNHHFTQPVALHGGGATSYANTFRATPARRAYRPPRVTPKPRISGVITGMVEPPPGGSVGKHADIDEQGRYTVRFSFDTSPPSPRGRSSRPIRMIQPHAGPNYGFHFPLHPGVEVAVTFVDGDPDRPLIQGAMPNPVTSSPVSRENAGMSRIQTASGIRVTIRDHL